MVPNDSRRLRTIENVISKYTQCPRFVMVKLRTVWKQIVYYTHGLRTRTFSFLNRKSASHPPTYNFNDLNISRPESKQISSRTPTAKLLKLNIFYGKLCFSKRIESLNFTFQLHSGQSMVMVQNV